MTTRPGYHSTRPPKPLNIDEATYEDYQRKAIQRTLRTATRDAWTRTEIRDVLEALGLIEPTSRVPAPSAAPENVSTEPSEASTARDRGWCTRQLHRMAGENVYTDPNGYRACRKCRQAMRAGAEPGVMHPAEPGSPHHDPAAEAASDGKESGDLWCGRKLHPMVGDNVAINKYGKRECRECRNWRRRRERARRRGEPFDEEPG
jgi:hypothetical protein